MKRIFLLLIIFSTINIAQIIGGAPKSVLGTSYTTKTFTLNENITDSLLLNVSQGIRSITIDTASASGVTLQSNIEQLSSANRWATNLGSWTVSGDMTATRQSDSSVTLNNIPVELNPSPNMLGSWTTLYQSDFSSSESMLEAALISSANNDGISDGTLSYDDTYKGYADGATSNHLAQFSGGQASGDLCRFTGSVYLPSANTNANGVQLGNSFNSSIIISGNSPITKGAWTNFGLLIAFDNNSGTRFYETKDGTTSFTGANSSSNDIMYLYNIKMEKQVLPTGWTASNAPTKSNYILNETSGIKFVSDGTSIPLVSGNILTSGHTYKYTITVTITSNGIKFDAGGGNPADIAITTTGTHTGTFVADGTTVVLNRNSGTANALVTYLSIVEVKEPDEFTLSNQTTDADKNYKLSFEAKSSLSSKKVYYSYGNVVDSLSLTSSYQSVNKELWGQGTGTIKFWASENATLDLKNISLEEITTKKVVKKGSTTKVYFTPNTSTIGNKTASITLNNNQVIDFDYDVVYSNKAYYVSNSGNDANDGLSQLTAWKTLEKVEDFDVNTGFNPGDKILFDATSVFNYPNLTLTSSGSAVAPIELNTYNGTQAVFNSGKLLTDYVVKEVPSSIVNDTSEQNLDNTNKTTIASEYYTGYKVTFTAGTLTKYFALSSETSPVKSQVKLYTSSDGVNFSVVANSESAVLESTVNGINTYNLKSPLSITAGDYWIVLVANSSRYIPYQTVTSGTNNYFYYNYSNAWNTGETEATFLNTLISSTSRHIPDVAVGAEIQTVTSGLNGTIYKAIAQNVKEVRLNGDQGVLGTLVNYNDLDDENEYAIIDDSVFVFNDITNNIAIIEGYGLKIDGNNYSVKNLYFQRNDSALVFNGSNIIADSLYLLNNSIAFANNDFNTIKQSKFIQNKTSIANDKINLYSNWFINSGLNGYSTIKLNSGESSIIHNSFYTTLDGGKSFIENTSALDTLVNNIFQSSTNDYLIYTSSLIDFIGANAYIGNLTFYKGGTTYTSANTWMPAMAENNSVVLGDANFTSLYDLDISDNTTNVIDAGLQTLVDQDIHGNEIPYDQYGLGYGSPDIGASEYQGNWSESSGGGTDGSITADYYFDSALGNDANNGTSELTPKKTLSSLQTLISNSGNSGKVFAVKRGSKFVGSLLLTQSGTLGDSTTITSYGSGEKPILTNRDALPNWNNTANWTLATGSVNANVWFIYLNCNVAIDRMWFDNAEIKLAEGYRTSDDNLDGTYGVNSTHKFYFDNTNNLLYVYSPSNPASYYTNMDIPFQISGGIANQRTLDIQADYYKFENLDIQGGAYSSVGLNGADNLNFESCNIGKYTNWRGLMGDEQIASDKTSDSVRIANCTFSSDWDYDYKFYTARTPSGIVPASGSNNWKIHHNLVKDWWMGVYVVGRYAATKYHEIHHNEITSPNFSFCKAIQISSGGIWGTDEETACKVYNNYIHDIIFGFQISSDNNIIYYNTIEDLTILNTNEHAIPTAGGYGITIIGDTQDASPTGNIFFNNTFKNLIDNAAIYDGKNSEYINNLFVNTGTTKSSQTTTGNYSHSIYRNNLFYKDNATTSSYRVYQSSVGYYTLSQFNTLTDGVNNVDGIDNLEYIGLEENLINVDLSLPTESAAKSAGYSNSTILGILGNNFYDQFGNQVTNSSGALIKTLNIGAVNN